MGLKYYLNLIKKESDAEAVKLKHFINIFLGLSAYVLIVLYFVLRNTNAIMSGVCGMAAMALMILGNIFMRRFQKFLLNIIDNDTLDESGETDAAFISYRKGYAESVNKPVEKIFNICGTVYAAIYIAAIQFCIVLDLTDNFDLAERVKRVVFTTLWIYIGVIFLYGAVTGAVKGVWTQNYTRELSIIKSYKSGRQAADGIAVKQKYSITEDKKVKEQIKYLFKDTPVYGKHNKLKSAGSIAGALMGAFLVVFFITLGQSGDSKAGLIACIIFGCLDAVFLAATIVLSVLAYRIMKGQYLKLKENEIQNAQRIKLHELRTPFYKRWNIIMALVFVGAIISNIVFSSIVNEITGSESYGVIFFLLFWVEIITMFVLFFKSFGRLRFKMMPLEDEIDKLEGRRKALEIRIG